MTNDPPAAAPVPVPFRIVAGGDPDEVQRAAIARALAVVTAGSVAEVAGGHHVPAWTRAALLEATSPVTVTSPQDLRP